MVMKTACSSRAWAALCAAALLVACASGGPGAGPTAGSQSSGGAMGSSSTGAERTGTGQIPEALTPMDREAMCAVYHSLQNARTPQERQSIMDQHMQGMPPEAREHHLDMMRQQCSH